MQITGGKFKGFKIKVPKKTRPTSSFNRKRIFDILRNVENLEVLDLFCGSGILGIEALSRGARSCTFVDIRSESIKVVSENIKKLGLENQTKVFKSDYSKFLSSLSDEKFDLIFADPPYNWKEHSKLLEMVKNTLRIEGIFVLEISSRREFPQCEGMEVIKAIKGGDTSLVFYMKKA